MGDLVGIKVWLNNNPKLIKQVKQLHTHIRVNKTQ